METSIQKHSNWRQRLPEFASIAGLALLMLLYWLIGAARDANLSYGFQTILNQSVIVALVATGAVFIYTLVSHQVRNT